MSILRRAQRRKVADRHGIHDNPEEAKRLNCGPDEFGRGTCRIKRIPRHGRPPKQDLSCSATELAQLVVGVKGRFLLAPRRHSER